VTYLGSYPRADKLQTKPTGTNTNAEFEAAAEWIKGLRKGH
jgi:hypothetical protein